ncbi:MAG TPA: hypothetical protein VH352_06685 [Pseudonocardiaceae bacterium]|jgi:hypothetical protein|nr:hypothetical protein [Pseudonocardiaceae bacterium]
MNEGSPISRREARDQLAELALGLTRVRRANVFLTAYRWRYEIAAAIGFPIALIELDHTIGWGWLLLLLAGLASMAWHWPGARRFVLARVRVVIVQHRLRTGFARARVCTLDGRLPAILWATPSEDGVQVLVSCPAGVGVDRIQAQRHLLAAACFASAVDVTRHRRHANLVVLSVRHPPRAEPRS